MKDSRKNLLQILYDYDQKEGGPLQITADGNEIGCDSLTLRNDVHYLKSNGYITEPMSILRSYVLALTEKGEHFVENGFQLPSENQNQPASFNFSNANLTNAVIGNHISGNDFAFNSNSFPELCSLIKEKSVSEQQELQELLSALDSLKNSEEPISHGFFARFSELVKKHTDLIVPIGKSLVEVLFGVK